MERSIISDDSAVNVMIPRWSPDGKRLAFLRWWSPERASLCIRSMRDSSTTSVYEGPPSFPIGWSRDGRSIYVWDHEARRERITAISTDRGSPRIVMDIPILGETQNPVITPDGAKAVASVITHQKDAWLVENFQRDAK
jgi:Tol biopolymer transport system component